MKTGAAVAGGITVKWQHEIGTEYRPTGDRVCSISTFRMAVELPTIVLPAVDRHAAKIAFQADSQIFATKQSTR